MTGDDDKTTREDDLYAAIFAFLKRNATTIALIGPIFVVALLPSGVPGPLLVVIIYLFEAIAYAGVQRRRGVRPADPATALTSVARWTGRLIVIFATSVVLVIVASLFRSI